MSVQFQHDKIQSALAADPELEYLARTWSAVLRFEQPDRTDDLRFVDGTVSTLASATDVEPQVRIVGTDEGWTKLLAGDPAALWALLVGGSPYCGSRATSTAKGPVRRRAAARPEARTQRRGHRAR
jgi:putative sterol carrier protein